jgi:hypothetical protein
MLMAAGVNPASVMATCTVVAPGCCPGWFAERKGLLSSQRETNKTRNRTRIMPPFLLGVSPGCDLGFMMNPQTALPLQAAA